MKINYKGHSLDSEKVSGNLTKSEFKGLTIWFSYIKPIAISSDTYTIINHTSYSQTTSIHISIVNRENVKIRNMCSLDFYERLDRILDNTSNKRWNSYD